MYSAHCGKVHKMLLSFWLKKKHLSWCEGAILIAIGGLKLIFFSNYRHIHLFIDTNLKTRIKKIELLADKHPVTTLALVERKHNGG